MEQGKKILELIESLQGFTEDEIRTDHLAVLDEIDSRTHCCVINKTYLDHSTHPIFGNTVVYWEDPSTHFTKDDFVGIFTVSRDALKEIRPDGWYITTYNNGDGFRCSLRNHPYGKFTKYDKEYFSKSNLPTEELAELHAIIQAIVWENENGNT